MEAASGQQSTLGTLFSVHSNGSGLRSLGRIDPGVQPRAGLESTAQCYFQKPVSKSGCSLCPPSSWEAHT